MSIAARLDEVRARLVRAARASGRDPASIALVAVSKAQPAEAVREAFAAGQRAFGENYAQELVAKSAALADLPGIVWHFVGHLQTNKARVAARCAHVVHTVDSAALARELGKRAARERPDGSAPMPVLIEVNVGGEPQKAGAAPAEIDEVAEAVRAAPALELRGLMTVPPAGDPARARAVFETLASLRDLHGGPAALPELSMGMTADFEVAVACGATIVRVGTAIFGAR
ncbi:MAG: YggS family pyridoxal phosphate-dependent enzyme [Myxococcales bacterium]|nr:YggS family pyridoxal phosphate-dependent enzyme [Myxococcales bacterium]